MPAHQMLVQRVEDYMCKHKQLQAPHSLSRRNASTAVMEEPPVETISSTTTTFVLLRIFLQFDYHGHAPSL